MASVRKEAVIEAPVELVWDALRDVGAVHRRVVPGFLTDCRMDGDARIVTFANGMVAREVIVDLDDGARRLVWSARTERLEHHNASMQVFADGPVRCRAVWIADVLPHAAAGMVSTMLEQGMACMKVALASHSRPA